MLLAFQLLNRSAASVGIIPTGGGGGPSRPITHSTPRIVDRARQERILDEIIARAERGEVETETAKAVEVVAQAVAEQTYEAIAPAIDALALLKAQESLAGIQLEIARLQSQFIAQQVEIEAQRDEEDALILFALAA